MARITVEDCLKHISNRFELVRVAATRARQLDRGYTPKLDPTGEKSTLFALREIAEGKVDAGILESTQIQGESMDEDFQRQLVEEELERRRKEEVELAALKEVEEKKNLKQKANADSSEPSE